MDLEHLTKTQIILLVLLVSFVTSIATGIVTVTLLDQAPPAVTQTINRVVERTVERVVPDINNNPVKTKETTVVVKEDDLITASIEKTRGSIAKLAKVDQTEGGERATRVVALGIAVSDTELATDARALAGGDATYVAILPDGKEFGVEVVPGSAGEPFTLLKLKSPTPAGKAPVLSAVKFADQNALKLGSTIISISGSDRVSVQLGIIAGLPHATSTDGGLIAVETNIDSTKILSGAPLINIFGELVGVSTIAASAFGATSFAPAGDVQAAVASARKPSETRP